MKKDLLAAFAAILAMTCAAYAGETPSAKGAKVYFVNLKDGATVSSPVKIIFGLTGMSVAPAGSKKKMPAITPSCWTVSRSEKDPKRPANSISAFRRIRTTFISEKDRPRKHLNYRPASTRFNWCWVTKIISPTIPRSHRRSLPSRSNRSQKKG